MTGKFPGLPITHRLIAALEDTDFVYLFRLESTQPLTAADRALFAGVVASAQRIPRRRKYDGDAFTHWAA